ncbi:MAG: FlxA-like family protein, partial [Methanomassiliicoccales archaeon]
QAQINDLQNQINSLQNQINDLQAQLNAEKAAREAADIELQKNIDAEETARAAGDSNLQDQIDDLQAQIDGMSSPNQLIQDFVVASGKSVTAGDVVSFYNGYVQKWKKTFGSEYVFNFKRTWVSSAAALTSTKFIVAFQDQDSGGNGTAVIGDVSGNTITFGSQYVFNWDNTMRISSNALSSNKFVVAYQDLGNYGYGTAVIGDVSGSTITFGSEYVFNSAITSGISAAALSSSKFAVAYVDQGNSFYGTAVIGDVSGNTITFGSEYVFNSDYSPIGSATALSSTKFVVAYMDYGNSKYGTAVVAEVSGSTMTFGSEYVFNSAETGYISAAALSSTKFVVAYKDMDGSSYGTVIIGEVTGSTITFGSEYVFNPESTLWISAAAFSSNKFVVAYGDNSYYGTVVIGDVSGSTITFGSEHVFHTYDTPIISVAALSSNKFVVAYVDPDDAEYGKAVIGEAQEGVPEGSQIVGVAKESKTAGESVQVIIDGVSDVHSGLTPGEIYYVNYLGSLTTEITLNKIGMAISSTALLLADPFF